MNEFYEYYLRFKILYEQHKKMFGNRSPNLPALFTESLCRDLFKLKKLSDKKFDAFDKKNKNIEIKATSSKKGTTTISKERFDSLYWMYFNLEEDILTVRIMPYVSFQDVMVRNQKQTNSRINISLQYFISESDKIIIFKIVDGGFVRA